jgi:hypothetical protein
MVQQRVDFDFFEKHRLRYEDFRWFFQPNGKM